MITHTLTCPTGHEWAASIGAFSIMIVEPGTVIRDEAFGREEPVDDTGVVSKGKVIYCTDLIFKELKRAIEAQ